jgi:hypothetical protein
MGKKLKMSSVKREPVFLLSEGLPNCTNITAHAPEGSFLNEGWAETHACAHGRGAN